MTRSAIHRLLSAPALCVAALLPACGPEGPPDLADVDPSGQQVLLWYAHSGEREAALQELIDRFNQSNPHDIVVRGEHIGSHAELYHSITLGIEGGPLPQITEAYQNQVRSYHQAGIVVDLAPYMSSPSWGWSEAERADMIPEFLQQDQLEGQQLALLPNRSMEVLYYNRDWLAELGYDEPPARWDDFAAMCRAAAATPFSRGSGATAATGILYERDASRVASIIFSLGGQLMNEAGTAYSWDTPEARQALGMIRDLAQDGAARLVDDNEDRAAFVAGDVLFAQRSSAGAAQIAQEIQEGGRFEWGVVGLPSPLETPVPNLYGASLAVLRSTPPQQLAAWLFVDWFLEPAQQDRWASASGYFPARRSVANQLAPYFRVAYNLLPHGRPEPSVGGYEPVRALVVDALVDVVEEGGDLDDALTRLQAEADKTLLPYR